MPPHGSDRTRHRLYIARLALLDAPNPAGRASPSGWGVVQIGFLYLRYVADPKTLFGWFEEYLTDEEEIQPSPDGKVYTMGTYVRDMLLEQV